MSRPGTGPRIIKRKQKQNYYIRFIDTDGKQKERSTGTKNRAEAEEALETFLRERRVALTSQAIHPTKMTVAQILEDYARFIENEREASRFGYAIEHVLDFWEDSTLDKVNKETIKAYVESSPRAKGTVRRELTCLRAAINHAVSMNRVLPIAKLSIPKGGKPKDRWLTRTEMARLLRAAGRECRSKFTLRLFILIAFYTGARRNAIMELEWSQIDFETGTIDFNKPGQEETNKRRAKIPIPKKLLPHLQRQYRFSKDKNLFLFHQRHAPYNRVQSIVKGFRTACKRAGLQDVTPHTLRHTRVSLLVQSGEKISDVAAFMNMSFPTLERVYAHHNDQHIRDMADRM